MKATGAGLIGVLLMLGGCMISEKPAPRQADVVPSATWRTPGPETPPITARWWEAYGDQRLTALIDRALANNNDIALAAARVREAAASEALARAQLFPAISAGGAASHGRALNAFGTPTVSTTGEPLAQVAWQVDLFGRLADLKGAARERYLASLAARDAAALSVAAATASGYVTLRALDARLEVARATLVSRSEALRLAKSRADAGYTSQLELRQAQAEYEATAQIVPQVERAIAAQENGLSVLLGENPHAVERGRPLDALPAPLIGTGLPSTLLRRRPDIAQAEHALAASDRNLASQRKAFLPNVQLTGSAGRLFVSQLPDPVNIFSIGGSILAPIFDGNRARAGADAAAAQRDQAAFAYRGVVLNAFQEVENAIAALNGLAAEGVRIEAQRNALAQVLRHARNRYQAGYADYLTELDAQRGVLAADLALVQNKADRLTTSIALYRALGGGWEPIADGSPLPRVP